ncbi:MAG: DinB family protein [Mycobacteriales bacterium]
MSPGDVPPLTADERAATADERTTLAAFLDLYRGIVAKKVAGLADADARRRLVSSPTTVGGIVKHLRWVEFGWFSQLLGQRSGDNLRAHDRASEFRFEPDETLAGLLADYAAECERSRAVAATHSLDAAAPHRRLGRVSLRWIYVHMIEETARHAGHLDILREQIDGSTGFD